MDITGWRTGLPVHASLSTWGVRGVSFFEVKLTKINLKLCFYVFSRLLFYLLADLLHSRMTHGSAVRTPCWWMQRELLSQNESDWIMNCSFIWIILVFFVKWFTCSQRIPSPSLALFPSNSAVSRRLPATRRPQNSAHIHSLFLIII